MSEEIIEISCLRKGFGESEVLKGISVTVNKGEVMTIIGSFGSGEFTLLRCIDLLERPTGGGIIYNGESVLALRYNLPKYRINLDIAFQSSSLFNNTNVLESCMSGQTTVLKRGEETVKKVTVKNPEKVGMDRYVEVRLAQLSGGQEQRVVVARASSMDPDILLFDESASALDPEMAGEVPNTIKNLARTGLTMPIMTHEMESAEDTSDRIIFMDKGVIAGEGTPEGIFVHLRGERTEESLSRILNAQDQSLIGTESCDVYHSSFFAPTHKQ